MSLLPEASFRRGGWMGLSASEANPFVVSLSNQERIRRETLINCKGSPR